MRKTKHSKYLLGLACLVGTAAAPLYGAEGTESYGQNPSQTVDRALQVELTGDGLGVIASLLKSNVLRDIHNMALPDVHQPVGGGASIDLTGLKTSVTFDSLDLQPSDGSLLIKVGLHDLQLSIDKIELSEKVFGWKFGDACYGTVFHIAQQGVVYLNMGITPTVENTELSLSAGAVDFRVSSDNYRVEGPSRCSGITGHLSSGVLHQILAAARPFLGMVVKDRVRSLMPAVSKSLNDQTHVTATLNLKNIPTLPERTVQLDAFPSRLNVNKEAFKVELGVRLTEVAPKIMLQAPTEEVGGDIRYGSLGLNPGVITAAFQTLWPEGGDYYDMSETVKDMLDVNSMASIWPDLNIVKPTQKFLKVQVRLGAPPELAADGKQQVMTAHLPKVQVKFQANIDNIWRDYYIIDLNLHTGATATIANNQLAVTILKDSTVDIAGHWAPGYTPKDEKFDKDTAQMIFSSLLEVAYARGPLVKAQLPTVQLGTHQIHLATPHIDAPYVAVDMR